MGELTSFEYSQAWIETARDFADTARQNPFSLHITQKLGAYLLMSDFYAEKINFDDPERLYEEGLLAVATPSAAVEKVVDVLRQPTFRREVRNLGLFMRAPDFDLPVKKRGKSITVDEERFVRSRLAA